MTPLSKHFTVEELTASQTAVRKGIDNTPSLEVLANLKRVAAMLEQVREVVDGPIQVSSGYRSVALNKAVGGAADSAHVRGLAADITAPGWEARALARKILGAGIKFDQLIYEGTWVHIGLSEDALRQQALTATFTNGRASYSDGIA